VTAFLQTTMRRLGAGGVSGKITDTLQLSSLTAFAASSAGSVLTMVLNLVLMILFLVFLLLGSEDFAEKITRAFTTEGSARVSQILAQINVQVRRYLMTKTLINLIVAAVTVVTMLLFGVDFALFTGVLTFFLNYIPNFGALISTIFPGVVSLLQYESFGLTAVFVLVLTVLHNIIGNFVEPKLMGSNLNLSPLVVLLSLIFWGYVWGVWGMVLAIPVVSIIKIVCENVAPLRPIAILISTPPEKAREKEKQKIAL
jgi:predicted PurR-regulated permease PerM